MGTIEIGSKSYNIDEQGFLVNFFQWDEQFASFMAPRYSIPTSLTQRHWDLIYFIRKYYMETGRCPLVYRACRQNRLRLQDLRHLFPSGYLRGACRLAGITYKQAVHSGTGSPMAQPSATPLPDRTPRTYVVDAQGFLMDPDNWDKQFSIHKAVELKMPDALTDAHWRIIHYLRNHYTEQKEVPVVYDTCDAFNMEIEDLESLFPDGYHRGAIKIAGLPAL